MKNRLYTFLIVLLMAFMVTCTTSPTVPPAPLPCDAWTVVSVISSLGAGNIQPKFGQAVGGKFELSCGSSGIYVLKTPAGAITTGGTGTVEITANTATEGRVVLDPTSVTRVTFSYSNLTATSVTLSGDVTAGTGASTQNVHTIVLKRP